MRHNRVAEPGPRDLHGRTFTAVVWTVRTFIRPGVVLCLTTWWTAFKLLHRPLPIVGALLATVLCVLLVGGES